MGDRVELDRIDFIVRRLEEDRIAQIGVALEPERDGWASPGRRLRQLAARLIRRGA